jgi:hypothetical protein
MTRQDIEQWTREAGGFDATPEFLAKFAALVASAEREECAKIADIAEPYNSADLIRARGNT